MEQSVPSDGGRQGETEAIPGEERAREREGGAVAERQGKGAAKRPSEAMRSLPRAHGSIQNRDASPQGSEWPSRYGSTVHWP